MKICTLFIVIFLAALTNADNPKLVFTFGADTIVQPEYLETFEKFLWPKRVIPYEIADNTFDKNEMIQIEKAIRQLNDLKCVKFLVRENEEDYVVIERKKPMCFADVGRIGGAQTVNLGKRCFFNNKGSPLHDLLHVLGLMHEQNRFDRDDYVDIKWSNVKRGSKKYFDKLPNNIPFPLNSTKYDFKSIMHSHKWIYTKNGEYTIIPRVAFPRWIGTAKNRLSKNDITKIKMLYGCKEA